MKEVLVSVMSISVCTALLTTTLVNDKFKSNVRAISSLILALFVVSQFQHFDINKLEVRFDTEVSQIDMFESVSLGVEEIINKTVSENIIKNYPVHEIYVKTNGFFSESEYEIRDITIEINTATPIYEILTHVEDEFGLKGKVSVIKITDEVDRNYEVE